MILGELLLLILRAEELDDDDIMVVGIVVAGISLLTLIAVLILAL